MSDTWFVILTIGFVIIVHLAFLCWATSLPEDVWRWIKGQFRKG